MQRLVRYGIGAFFGSCWWSFFLLARPTAIASGAASGAETDHGARVGGVSQDAHREPAASHLRHQPEGLTMSLHEVETKIIDRDHQAGEGTPSLAEDDIRSLQEQGQAWLCVTPVPETEFQSTVFATIDTAGANLTQGQLGAIAAAFRSSHQEATAAQLEGNYAFCDPYFREVQNVTIVADEILALNSDYKRVQIHVHGICQACQNDDMLFQDDSEALIQVPTSSFNDTSSGGGCTCPANVTQRLVSKDELLGVFSNNLLDSTSLELMSIQQAVTTTCGMNVVPFTFRSIVEFNQTCGTGLSVNDKQALGIAYVTSYNQLSSQYYCDPYFRVLERATIVQEGAATAEGKLGVEVEVTGTLRCVDPTAPDCIVDEIGLFDLPSKTLLVNGQRNRQRRGRSLQQGECSCPLSAMEERGILESEFLDEFEVQVAAVAATLECSYVKVVGDSAQEASAQIEAAALDSLNAVFTPDDPSICNLDFRVFESVKVVFTNAVRRLDQDDNASDSLSARDLQSVTLVADQPSLSPTSLVGSLASSSLNPTTVFDSPQTSNSTTSSLSSTTVGLLVISGACSGCRNELWPENQISNRRLSSSSRNLQNNVAATSNCFCGLNATVFEMVPSILEFESILEEQLQLEITGIAEINDENVISAYMCGMNLVPFTFRSIVEFNQTCGTGLSVNDKQALGIAYVSSYNQLASQYYCDPYFRVLEKATIVQEGDATAEGKLGVEVEVTGTLRCVDPTAPDCIVDEIGLFDLPSKTLLVNGQRNRQRRGRSLQQGECSCPLSAMEERGILESEFLDEFEVQVAAVAATLECPNVEVVGDCAFGSLFDSVLQVTFADPIAAQEVSAQIEAAALDSLNAAFSPDDPSICNLDFRVFDSVQVVFTNDMRRRLDKDILSDRYSGRRLQENSSLLTSEPSSSPTIAFGQPQSNSSTSTTSSTVGLLVISGACAGCSDELFPANQVSNNGRSLEDLRGWVEQRSFSRHLQENSLSATSNCFCGLDATVFDKAPNISEFQALLEEQLQLEITSMTQVENDALVFTFPCTANVSSFDKNVTLEIQYTCGTSSDPELPDEVRASIANAFKQTYNSLTTNVCDPSNIRIDSARVIEVGKFRNGTSSLPLQLTLTVLCNGCDVSSTNLYGFPSDDGSPPITTTSRRDLSFLEEKVQDVPPGTRRAQQEGTCTCSALLPRRAPLEAEVTAATNPMLQDPVLPCIGNTTECQFGSEFAANILFEIELGATLDAKEAAEILLNAFTQVLSRVINCDNPHQCNEVAGYLTDAGFLLEFVYNSLQQGSSNTTDSTNTNTTRRNLQFLDGNVDTNSTLNISDAPSASPTASIDSTVILLSSSGVCNGCPSDLLNGNQASARRAMEALGDLKGTQMEYRFLQDGIDTAAQDSPTCTNNTSGESRPESDCYCPLSSVVIASSLVFDQVAFIQKIIDTAQALGADFVVTGSEFITQVECQAETSFTTFISFEFSAFQWIIYNMNDVQVLGDQIAKAYNTLVAQHCDQYFRNSVTLTFVPGTLQLTSSDGARRHGRHLQLGCYNYIATFRVDGLCRGCQDLGSSIPLFGSSSIRELGVHLIDWEGMDRRRRRGLNKDSMTSDGRQLQESTATCVCDGIASQNPDAPSRAVIQSEISAVNWAALGEGTICGLPVDPVVDCPRFASEMGIAETMPISFWVSRKDGECLTVADVTLLAATFMQEYNAIKGDGRYFPCQPEYVQISAVTFDPNIVANCARRRRLVDGRWLRDGITVELDFTANSNTGTNLAQTANTDNTVEAAQTNVNLKTGLTVLSEGSPSPSAIPSAFPSSFPSTFPSTFPSEHPSPKASASPSPSPTITASTRPSVATCFQPQALFGVSSDALEPAPVDLFDICPCKGCPTDDYIAFGETNVPLNLVWATASAPTDGARIQFYEGAEPFDDCTNWNCMGAGISCDAFGCCNEVLLTRDGSNLGATANLFGLPGPVTITLSDSPSRPCVIDSITMEDCPSGPGSPPAFTYETSGSDVACWYNLYGDETHTAFYLDGPATGIIRIVDIDGTCESAWVQLLSVPYRDSPCLSWVYKREYSALYLSCNPDIDLSTVVLEPGHQGYMLLISGYDSCPVQVCHEP